MTSALLNSLVQYYERCREVSLSPESKSTDDLYSRDAQSNSNFYGFFKNNGVVPLVGYSTLDGLNANPIDEQIARWLIDRDTHYLVTFSDFVLFPIKGNVSDRTEAYRPMSFVNGFEVIRSEVSWLKQDLDYEERMFNRLTERIRFDAPKQLSGYQSGQYSQELVKKEARLNAVEGRKDARLKIDRLKERLSFLESLDIEGVISTAPNFDRMFPDYCCLDSGLTYTLRPEARSLGVTSEFNPSDTQIDLRGIPRAEMLHNWLVNQACKLSTPIVIPLYVRALVPIDMPPLSFRDHSKNKVKLKKPGELVYDSNKVPLLHQILTFKYPVSTNKRKAKSDLKSTYSKLQFSDYGSRALSEAQNNSVKRALDYTVSVVQGPPGTGKTYTLATIVTVLACLGKSVLITARGDNALQVVKQKLIEEMHVDRRFIFHYRSQSVGKGISAQLKRVIERAETGHQSNDIEESIRQLTQKREVIDTCYVQLESDAQRVAQLTENEYFGGNLIDRINRRFIWPIKYKNTINLNHGLDRLLQVVEDYEIQQGGVASTVMRNRFLRSYESDIDTWKELSEALNSMSLQTLLEPTNQKRLTKFNPSESTGIWLANLEDVSELGDQKFDYVLVDEASQVNMAEVIPSLAVANALIAFGDRKQLRHRSFISVEREQRIAKELDLPRNSYVSFRDTSFLDYIDTYVRRGGDVSALTLLNQNFRSAPPLVEFNSEQFYQGDIEAMTGLATSSHSSRLHLSWKRVKGTREKKVNREEAEALVLYLKDLIEQDRESTKKTSYGVLSFFREQADYLKKRVLHHIDIRDINIHQIQVGTPFSNQGLERDHMLISCAIDDNSHRATLAFMDRPDIFNVATSRAKFRQTIFLSASPEKLSEDSLLRIYHGYSQSNEALDSTFDPRPWLAELVNEFNKAGFNTQLEQRIARDEVDLVLVRERKRIVIDLIGFPSHIGVAIPLQRKLQYARIGIPVFTLTVFQWMYHRTEVFNNLMHWLEVKDSRLDYDIRTLSEYKAAQPVQGLNTLSDKMWADLLRYSSLPELVEPWDTGIEDVTWMLVKADRVFTGKRPEELAAYTYYQEAVQSLLQGYLENLDNYLLLHQQVWREDLEDHSFWVQLISPIKEKHSVYTRQLEATFHGIESLYA